MGHVLLKNRAARLAALGLLICLCYALFQPVKPYASAVPLPDDPDVQQIDQTIRQADLSNAMMAASDVHSLLLRWISNGAAAPLTLNGSYTPEDLQAVLRSLIYQSTSPADWAIEDLWLEKYGRPLTLRLTASPGNYVDIYCWENCPEVWVVRRVFDPKIGTRWSDTVKYTAPVSSDAPSLYTILRTANSAYLPQPNTPDTPAIP